MDQPPRAQEHHKQHGQRIAIGGLAVEIEIEHAEQRPDVDALQAVEPPVSQPALFAASCSSRPKPSVIMISVRWRKRAMMKLVA